MWTCHFSQFRGAGLLGIVTRMDFLDVMVGGDHGVAGPNTFLRHVQFLWMMTVSLLEKQKKSDLLHNFMSFASTRNCISLDTQYKVSQSKGSILSHFRRTTDENSFYFSVTHFPQPQLEVEYCVSPRNRKNTVFLQVFYFFVFNCQVKLSLL